MRTHSFRTVIAPLTQLWTGFQRQRRLRLLAYGLLVVTGCGLGVGSLQARGLGALVSFDSPRISPGTSMVSIVPDALTTPIDTITLCHHPAGNPANAHTITIGYAAISTHEGHGDTLGPCVQALSTSVMTLTETLALTVTPTSTMTATATATLVSSATPTTTQTLTPTMTPPTTQISVPTIAHVDDDSGKVTICHRPPGNPANAHTITVGYSALAAHEDHADILGPCLAIIATSTYTPTLAPTQTLTVTVTQTFTATSTPLPTATSAVAETKATICHRPPGNPANAHTITIGAPAVPAHLGHGDSLGPCAQNQEKAKQNNKQNNDNGGGNRERGNKGGNGKGKKKK